MMIEEEGCGLQQELQKLSWKASGLECSLNSEDTHYIW